LIVKKYPLIKQQAPIRYRPWEVLVDLVKGRFASHLLGGIDLQKNSARLDESVTFFVSVPARGFDPEKIFLETAIEYITDKVLECSAMSGAEYQLKSRSVPRVE